ncbi:hypothetical protein D3C84_590240 [compost metagenome]
MLTEHALAHVVHARRQPGGPLIQLPGGAGDGVDHSLITGLHGVEGIGHLPDFIAASQWNAGRQITGFLDMQHHVFQRVQLAEQETDQQLRRTQHRQHQDHYRHRVLAKAFSEDLFQARCIGDHCDLLALRAGEHFGTHQRVVTEQRHGIDLDPTFCIAQFRYRLFVQHWHLCAAKRQQVIVPGQRLPGRPGTEQSRLRLSRGLGGLTAGLLFEMHGKQHQQQCGDKSDGIDCPEFVFQRDIAKPGTHGGLL